MRKLVLVALPAMLTAVPAMAQDASGNVILEGYVKSRCMFTVPSKTLQLNELAQLSGGAAPGKLDESQVNGKTETLSGWCNDAAAGITVEASELLGDAPVATLDPNFTSRVDFTATATANSVSATDSTLTGGPGATQNVGMFAGDVVVVLSAASAPGNKLLAAGDYTGNVKVTLTPVFSIPE